MLYAEYEEENEATTSYTSPVLKQRATAGKDYTAPSPKLVVTPREKPRKHYLFSVGVGMCLFVGLLMVWTVVIEVVNKKYSVYTIPATLAPDKLVTLSVADANNDGKLDLVVHVEGEEGVLVLFN